MLSHIEFIQNGVFWLFHSKSNLKAFLTKNDEQHSSSENLLEKQSNYQQQIPITCLGSKEEKQHHDKKHKLNRSRRWWKNIQQTGQKFIPKWQNLL